MWCNLRCLALMSLGALNMLNHRERLDTQQLMHLISCECCPLGVVNQEEVVLVTNWFGPTAFLSAGFI